MNYPITVNGSLVSVNEEEVKKAVQDRIAQIGVLAVSPYTITSCEGLRKDHSKFLKETKAMFEEARKNATKDIDACEQYVNSLLLPLKEANEAFDKQIKQAKSTKFKVELKNKYFDPNFGQPDENGEILSFDEIFDPTWEKLGSMAKANAAMVATIINRNTAHESYDVVLQLNHVSNQAWKEVESCLIKNRVVYDVLTKEKK